MNQSNNNLVTSPSSPSVPSLKIDPIRTNSAKRSQHQHSKSLDQSNQTSHAQLLTIETNNGNYSSSASPTSASSANNNQFVSIPSTPHYLDTNEELFFFNLHHYSTKEVEIPETETAVTLFVEAIHILESVIAQSKYELEFHQKMTTDPSHPMIKHVTKFISNIDNLLSQVQELKDKSVEIRRLCSVIQLNPKSKEQIEQETCDNLFTFVSENRNFLLFTLHAMSDISKNLQKLKSMRSKGGIFFSLGNYQQEVRVKLLKFIVKLQIIRLLAKGCNMIADNRIVCANRVLEKGFRDADFMISPFCDSVEIAKFKEINLVDPRIFFLEVGTQYVPLNRMIFMMLIRVIAAHGKTHSFSKYTHIRHAAFSLNSLYFMLNPEEATTEAFRFMKNIRTDSGRLLWEMIDSGVFQLGHYVTLPNIAVSKIFTIPGCSMENINDKHSASVEDFSFSTALQNSTNEKNDSGANSAEVASTPNSGVASPQSEEEVEMELEEKIGKQEAAFESMEAKEKVMEEHIKAAYRDIDGMLPDGSCEIRLAKEFYDKFPQFLKDYNFENIQLRIVSPFEIKTKIVTPSNDFPFMSKVMRVVGAAKTTIMRRSQSTESINQGCLIFHIHGGGFVAMSSNSHESYLRKWATDCNCPIISVDYRKAPELTQPQIVAECFTAYKWVVKHADEIIGGPLKKLIITGDSAGGNLSFAVTLKAIYENIRLPDGVVLTYPATLLATSVSSARAMSVVDPLVGKEFLMMCFSCIMKEENEGRRNPFISVSAAPKELLKKFPATYINIGTLDPLYDDGVYAARRIAKYNGGKCAVDIYDGMGHGYLNFVSFVPQAQEASKNITNWMNKLFSS